MIKDRIVRVKLKKYFKEQKPVCYVGKVTAFSENWVVMDAKGLMLTRGPANGVQIDTRANPVMIPRESIDSIRIMPDNFDINKLDITTEGVQIRLVVDGQRDVFLGEMNDVF